jgi:hypothetical protein
MSRFSIILYSAQDDSSQSLPGEIWIVRDDRVLIEELFLEGPAGWSITENGQNEATLPGGGIQFEDYSYDQLHSYILGSDHEVLIQAGSSSDTFQWHFQAPHSFLGRYPAAYGGNLSFVLGALEGHFSFMTSNTNMSMVRLRCTSCQQGGGMELVYLPQNTEFDPVQLFDEQLRVRIPLLPFAWRKTPDSSLKAPGPVSECEMMSMLSELSALLILGDYTTGHESVALDAVTITAGSGTFPQSCLYQNL